MPLKLETEHAFRIGMHALEAVIVIGETSDAGRRICEGLEGSHIIFPTRRIIRGRSIEAREPDDPFVE